MFRFETERLVIKPHTPLNAARYHQWVNDPDLVYVIKDDSDTFQPSSLEESQKYIDDVSRNPQTESSVYFAIHARADDAFIGYGMIMQIDRYHRRCKLGLTIGERSEWGKGYAREALIPVIDYCFGELGLNRIAAEIYCFNKRSIQLFEGLGFRHEGTLRQVVWKGGQPLDDCLYALLREDWEHRP